VTNSAGPRTGEDQAIAPGSIRATSLSPRLAQTKTPGLFEKLPAKQTGVDLVTKIVMGHELELINHTVYVIGGAAIGDLNGDQRPDLFFANGLGANRLYLQVGDFKFKDISKSAQVGGQDAWGVGAALVDVDNDADLDIYVCNYDSPNQLFINTGNGKRFMESAQAYGLDLHDASVMSAWADYDNDGDLDAFVLTYRFYRPGGRPQEPPVAFKAGQPYILPKYEKYYFLQKVGPQKFTIDNCGSADHLYRNNGDGTFTDVSQAAGIKEKGHGLSVTWWDYNSDGLIDIYVGNDFADPDHLYRNNGDGTFSEALADVMPSITWSSMGADCADINNDGLLDFMSAEMAPTTDYKTKVVMGNLGDRSWFLDNGWPRQIMRNHLFLNTGAGAFMEVAFLCKLAQTDWTWAPKLADFDNDGRIDVFISNGCARMSNDADVPVTIQMLIGQTEWDIWKKESPLQEQNLAFRNEGACKFSDVSQAWGLDHVGMSYSSAYGDLDRDGDLDLVVMCLNEEIALYRNQNTTGHRVTIKLKGAASNVNGLGAIVRLVTAAGTKHVRQMNPMTGFASCNDPSLHFGLGQEKLIKELEVTWPSGLQQVFRNLEVDQHYLIAEPVDAAQSRPPKLETPDVQFVEVAEACGLAFVHRETAFDDYKRQPLLPGKLSQLGGGLAWADVNDDGLADLFVAGAKDQGGQLFLNRGQGQFVVDKNNQQPFELDQRYEDMAPLFFEANGDGAIDLLITSGSVECQANADALQDRLYLNDGSGHFTRAPHNTLPKHRISTSVAVCADFDRDADLDLFIGGRVIPGRYPVTPRSQLLRNDQGKFTDITDTFAPGLKTAGMVTSALWSDVNKDAKIDLLVTTEWGPVRLFINAGDKLEDLTQVSGLDQRHGWWNSITGADFDQDGDIDYVVMNAGLNSKYGDATPAAPIRLYYGPLADNNVQRLIEVKYVDDTPIPVRSLDCLLKAIPAFDKRFPTFRSYAASSLTDIFSPARLQQAERYEVNYLESCILINNWDKSAAEPRFTLRPLPRLAQASPGFGVVATDFEGDGLVDIYAVQNLYTRESRNTGVWNGGVGVMLRTNPQLQLDLLAPTQTGLLITGDAKGLTVCDLNHDGWPDLVATQNNARLLAFQNTAKFGVKPLAVKLRGPISNPSAIGALVTACYMDGHQQAAERYGGSGYLSQSIATLFFGRGAQSIQSIQVRWPDGRQSSAAVASNSSTITIEHPEK
jgi:enediyne biosynthesis protein E4